MAAKRGRSSPLAPSSRGRGDALRAYVVALRYWAPVWLPLVVCLHFAVRGLLPAWRESRRIDRQEELVDARVDALQDERAAIERDRLRLADPIWRERVRRSLLDPAREPLTLADER